MITKKAKRVSSTDGAPPSGVDAERDEPAVHALSAALRRRLERVGELAQATLEISPETRALILEQVTLKLDSVHFPDDCPSTRDGHDPNFRSARRESPGAPVSATERLEQLERRLARIRRTFEALARIDRTVSKDLMSGEG